ncbi:MAG: NAD-dependent malic enzyme [Nitrosopumilus sp.]|nr:NAD-dependent malic enzyme [Nitrosopumilus sp.]MDH3516056.1 NAD-dependent malic enzyme [Nitrosopumilus sp.]MDH3564543.1 NAD-dependent malic enzyme [Nitrosopumilus sp.]MDH5417879.1 NAD-dependent malic enzyme [Nitrosopumilus sp.]MDH5554714.1 NAD-dependent malic enzyme [Nitrosopumilus sp.]
MTKNAIILHKKLKGKIYIESKIPKITNENLQLIYTPGVATVCKEILNNPNQKYHLTTKGNNVAIITDGTRILGLGDIGPDAALPVMEGKSVLYREYGKINAYPICLNTTDKKKIIDTIIAIEPMFGAINLEDIESPKVLDISNEIVKKLSIPVFHDDRHGTAIVVLAAMINSLKIMSKKISEIKVVIVGAGSAGYGIAKLLNFAGCKNIIVLDSKGAIHKKRKTNMNKYKLELAQFTNQKEVGYLEDVIKKADVFIGVSGIKNLLKPRMIKEMNESPIVFALTNPEPEIDPNMAKKYGASVVATGSFRYENKVNNALVFPYLMRSILDLKIQKVTLEILYVTALAIANTVPKNKLAENHIIPSINDKNLQKNITKSLTNI